MGRGGGHVEPVAAQLCHEMAADEAGGAENDDAGRRVHMKKMHAKSPVYPTSSNSHCHPSGDRKLSHVSCQYMRLTFSRSVRYPSTTMYLPRRPTRSISLSARASSGNL